MWFRIRGRNHRSIIINSRDHYKDSFIVNKPIQFDDIFTFNFDISMAYFSVPYLQA